MLIFGHCVQFQTWWKRKYQEMHRVGHRTISWVRLHSPEAEKVCSVGRWMPRPRLWAIAAGSCVRPRDSLARWNDSVLAAHRRGPDPRSLDWILCVVFVFVCFLYVTVVYAVCVGSGEKGVR